MCNRESRLSPKVRTQSGRQSVVYLVYVPEHRRAERATAPIANERSHFFGPALMPRRHELCAFESNPERLLMLRGCGLSVVLYSVPWGAIIETFDGRETCLTTRVTRYDIITQYIPEDKGPKNFEKEKNPQTSQNNDVNHDDLFPSRRVGISQSNMIVSYLASIVFTSKTHSWKCEGKM